MISMPVHGLLRGVLAAELRGEQDKEVQGTNDEGLC